MQGRAALGRLRTRVRKFYRDPVTFAVDLPNPVLAALLKGWIVVLMALSDLIDLRTWWVRMEWGLRRVRPASVGGANVVTDWTLRGADGERPRVWPARIFLMSTAEAVICALSERGAFLAGASVAPEHHAVINVLRQPFGLRVYALGDVRGLVEVEAAASVQILARELRRGVRFDTALKRAWPARPRPSVHVPVARYRRWLERTEAAAPPPSSALTVSVLMPVRDPPVEHLRSAIRSVLDQDHAALELCLSDDGSTSPAIRSVLAEAARDPRVRLVTAAQSRGIARATNAALDLASGDLVVFVDHDDVLTPDALAWMAATFADPQVEVAYSDEDSIDAHGRRSAPVFKSPFNPERLLAQNYLNHLFGVRTELVRRIGGLRPGYDGSQDHDLVLRLSEVVPAAGIRHVPRILYHWRTYPGGLSFSQTRGGQASSARQRAVEDHLARRGVAARVTEQTPGLTRVHWPLPEPLPSVQVIIPTKDRPDLLGACVNGLFQVTDYPNLSLTLVDNGDGDPASVAQMAELENLPQVTVIRRPGVFDHSDFNNAAAEAGQADVLLLLNDDILILEPDWLKEMVSLAVRPGVGAVGAKLFYPDGRLQHAGVVLGLGRDRVAGHESRGAAADAVGIQSRLLVTRRADAVTAGCMAIERRKFFSIGGFDAREFPVSFNDVDLCLRLERAGLETIWTPHARLIHIESASRGKAVSPEARKTFEGEVARMRARWGERLDNGSDYHPALSRADESFSLADPG